MGLAVLLLGVAEPVVAQTVILHMKNGDRIAGRIVSETTNSLVITTPWVKELSVPISEVARREMAPVALEQAAEQNRIFITTNGMTGLNSATPIPAVSVAPPHVTKATRSLSGEARIGADFLYGANNQQIYYGRLKLTYKHPYLSNPNEYFLNILDFSMDYGRTKTLTATNSETVLSANRLDATDKTDVDIGRRFYVYDLASVGYDEVRKINFRDEIGPGLGYHLFTHTNLVVNTEAGADYQEEYRSDDTTTKDYFYRLAEDVSWKLNHHLTLTEKYEFFPKLDAGTYRSRFESTLSYALWLNLSLNVTVLDLYDSKPAQEVPSNDLQVRSSVGVKF